MHVECPSCKMLVDEDKYLRCPRCNTILHQPMGCGGCRCGGCKCGCPSGGIRPSNKQVRNF